MDRFDIIKKNINDTSNIDNLTELNDIPLDNEEELRSWGGLMTLTYGTAEYGPLELRLPETIWNVQHWKEKEIRINEYWALVSNSQLIESRLQEVIQNLFSKIEQRFQNLEDLIVKCQYHSIKVRFIDSDKWILKKPIDITIEKRAEFDIVVCFYEADIYEYGDNVSDAVNNLMDSIIHQYEFLIDEKEKYELGKLTTKQLNILNQIIGKKIKDKNV